MENNASLVSQLEKFRRGEKRMAYSILYFKSVIFGPSEIILFLFCDPS